MTEDQRNIALWLIGITLVLSLTSTGIFIGIPLWSHWYDIVAAYWGL